MRNKILTVGLILGIAFSLVTVGFAYMGEAGTVMENVTIENYYAGQVDAEAGMVGITTRDNFQAADLTATDDLVVADDASVGGDLSVTGSTAVNEFTQGGGAYEYATSTGTTVLTEAEMLAYNYIELTVNTGSTATLQLPATSTMTSLIPNAGDMREWLVENATSSTMALTIGAGTGIDLIAYTTNDDVIDATEWTRITCIRQADTDVTCITSELLQAD